MGFHQMSQEQRTKRLSELEDKRERDIPLGRKDLVFLLTAMEEQVRQLRAENAKLRERHEGSFGMRAKKLLGIDGEPL